MKNILIIAFILISSVVFGQGQKISNYPSKTTWNNNDLFDCSSYKGIGNYKTEKFTLAQMKAEISGGTVTTDSVFVQYCNGCATVSGWKFSSDTIYIDTIGGGGGTTDTTSLSNRIDTKISYTDTTSLIATKSDIPRLTSTQIAFGSASDSITSNSSLTYNNTTKTLTAIGGGTIGATSILDLKNGAVSPVSQLKVLDNGELDGTWIKSKGINSGALISIGSGALGAYTTGTYGAVAIGQNSGSSLNNQSSNTSSVFIGNGAGQNVVGGSNNVFIGGGAGQVSLGSSNTIVGNDIQYWGASATGSNNSHLGYQAGRYITTGSYNIFIGSYSGSSISNNDLNVMIGYRAGYHETGSNKLYIGSNTSGTDEATGRTTHLIYGDFSRQILNINGNLILPTASSGITLTSANGTKYKITVDNAGNLQTTLVP